MSTALTNFPGITIGVNDPVHGSLESSLRERNPDYLRVAASFFGIVEGMETAEQLSGRVHFRRTWQGDDVVRIKTQLRDEAGNETDEWSDWYETSSDCAEFDVYDVEGEVAATLFIRFGRVSNPEVSFVAQVGNDRISLMYSLHFWTYDHDGCPMTSGNLFNSVQYSQFLILRQLCLGYVKK